MKLNNILLIWLLIATVGTYQTPIVAQPLSINFFEGTWEEVLEKSKNENKLIFVDVYADYCPPCKVMIKEVFSHKDVALFYNQYFVNYKINLSNKENSYFTQMHQIGELPALMFFDAQGGVVHKETGCKETPEFLTFGKNVLQQYDKAYQTNNEERKYMEKLMSWYESGKKNTANLFPNKSPETLLIQYAYLLKEYRLPYNRVVNEYLKSQKNIQTNINRQFIYDFAISLDNNAMNYFVDDISFFKEKYGSNRVNDKVKTACYNTTINAAQEKDAALFNQVAATAGAANLPNSQQFIFRMQSIYYESINDWEAYAKAATKYITEQKCSDPILLNEVAYKFYDHITNKKQLLEAIKWTELSVRIDNRYNNNSTLMWLYYKMGKKKEAIAAGEAAIAAAQRDGETDYSDTMRLLEKLKK